MDRLRDHVGVRVLRDRSVQQATWAKDGKSIYVAYDDHGSTRIGRVTLDGKLTEVASGLAGGSLDRPYSGGDFSVGGNGGMTPKHAQLLASDLDTETLVRYVDRFVMYYIRTADRLQRTAPWVESLDGGLDHVREVVCDDSLGLAEEFEAAMARHVQNYKCEWKGVLEDPDKMSRFVSFVNAPDAVDSTVTFTERAGRKVPVPIGMPRLRG